MCVCFGMCVCECVFICFHIHWCTFICICPEDSTASRTDQARSPPPFSHADNSQNTPSTPYQPRKASSAPASQETSPDGALTFEAIGMLRATARALRATAEQLLGGVENLSSQIDQLAGSLHSSGSTPAKAAFAATGGVKDHLKRSYSDYTSLGGAGGSWNDAKGGDGNVPVKKQKTMKLDPSGGTDCGFTGELLLFGGKDRILHYVKVFLSVLLVGIVYLLMASPAMSPPNFVYSFSESSRGLTRAL